MSKDRSKKQKAYRDKQKASSKKKIINKPMTNSNKNVIKRATWNAEERFSISGDEYQALSNFANLVAPLVDTANRILGQAELDGKLTFEYQYEDNTPVEAPLVEAYEKERLEKLEKRKAEIEKYMKLLQEQNEKLQEQMKKVKKEEPTVEAPPDELAMNPS